MRNKKGNFLIVTGLLLMAAALCLAAYNVWDSARAGEQAQKALGQLLPAIAEPVPLPGPIAEGEDPDEVEYPDYIVDPHMQMPVLTVDGIDYIGTLNIPALEIELPVISEWSYPALKIAPCRYAGSAYLDDLCVCAHNYDDHFGRIQNLAIGDTVIFTDVDGNAFSYRVGEITVLHPTATEEMVESEWDLSLFTCTLGGRTRVTVRCEKTEE